MPGPAEPRGLAGEPGHAAAPGRAAPPVVVAVLTFRRPGDLEELLPRLLGQTGAVSPAAGVLVVDNDPAASAAPVVERLGTGAVRYVHEPVPGIAAARNRALHEAAGSRLLVFLDDDERPTDGWLRSLLDTHAREGGAGVVGPVVSEFAGAVHPWVAAGRFFDRRRLPTGSRVSVAATNNLLLDLDVVRSAGLRFDDRYGITGGSDTLFTLQLTRSGHELVWCDEAVVVDRVPQARATPRWVLARAFRSGNGWSRVSLELADGGRQRLTTRARLGLAGLVRVAGGGARWVAGALLRRADLRARGARTLARGSGLVTGAVGHVYAEYGRAP